MGKKVGRLKKWNGGWTAEQRDSSAWALLSLERALRLQTHDKDVVLTSFTIKDDGQDWFIILHGTWGGAKKVMFGRAGALLSLGSTIHAMIAGGKWVDDRYA